MPSRAEVERIQIAIYDNDNLEEEAFGKGPMKETRDRFRCRTAVKTFIKCGLGAKSTVMEIGCGQGKVTEALGEAGFSNVFAFDIAQRRIRALAQNQQEAGTTNPFLVARAQELPFTCQSFEGIVAYDVYEHLPKHEASQMLNEIFRVLRPQGIVILSTINALSLGKRLIRLAEELYPKMEGLGLGTRPDHPFETNFRELQGAFREHKFELLEIKGIGIIPGMWYIQRFFPFWVFQELNIKAAHPLPQYAAETLVIARKQ